MGRAASSFLRLRRLRSCFFSIIISSSHSTTLHFSFYCKLIFSIALAPLFEFQFFSYLILLCSLDISFVQSQKLETCSSNFFFFHFLPLPERLLSSKTNKIMGDLKRQMQHLPLFFFVPVSGRGWSLGREEETGVCSLNHNSLCLPLEPTCLALLAHFHLPAPGHFLKTTVASYLLARPLLPQFILTL